ncbi:MAG: hypothetical protein WBG09_00620, partial [Candidatus Sulfotelmatobacter sp.]
IALLSVVGALLSCTVIGAVIDSSSAVTLKLANQMLRCMFGERHDQVNVRPYGNSSKTPARPIFRNGVHLTKCN